MLSVKLHNNTLSLPDSWEDLTPVEYIKILHILNTEYFRSVAQLKILYMLTGYKISRKNLTTEKRDIINNNLRNLASLITFPFGDGIINHNLKRNPIPFIRIGLRKIHGLKFDIGEFTKTNITAIQFADAYELAKDYQNTSSQESLYLLTAILYPGKRIHSEVIHSDYASKFKNVDIAILKGVHFWFTSVIRYFMDDEIYGLLFKGEQIKDEDYISLGMKETILGLSEKGYGDIDKVSSLNVLDFFDLQIKNLKQIIQDALAKGAKTENIAKELNINYSTIMRLC